MKNETILKKAIAKAVKNGWKKLVIVNNFGVVRVYDNWEKYEISRKGNSYSVNDIIFSPDFSKAFFGEEPLEGWEYYQHQMLDEIQEGRDPIKYLAQYL